MDLKKDSWVVGDGGEGLAWVWVVPRWIWVALGPVELDACFGGVLPDGTVELWWIEAAEAVLLTCSGAFAWLVALVLDDEDVFVDDIDVDAALFSICVFTEISLGDEPACSCDVDVVGGRLDASVLTSAAA